MELDDELRKKLIETFKKTELYEKGLESIYNYATLMSYYKCAMMEVETKFNVLNEEFSLRYDRNPINSIKSRLKSPKSIAEKLEKKNCKPSIANIETQLNDIAGIRVCCSFIEDVYLLSDALLKQDDVRLIEKKDYIKNPKPNGYRSLHLIIAVPIFLASEKREMKVEIQLRTIAMDFWASLEHQIRYKKDKNFTEEIQRELLSCAEVSADLDRRMSELRELVE
ncbi:MAG: GTP pyrophosphokinase family protein [Christensenellaceae bacterium]